MLQFICQRQFWVFLLYSISNLTVALFSENNIKLFSVIEDNFTR